MEKDWAEIVQGIGTTDGNGAETFTGGDVEMGDCSDDANLLYADDREKELGAEAESEVDSSLLDIKHFANALRIPGMLHVSDNALGHILSSCRIWPELLKGLRLVEVLLCRPMYRERFLFTCVGEKKAREQNLNKWSHTLKGLRWQSILEFCLALVPLECLLRKLGCVKALFQHNFPSDLVVETFDS